MEKLNIKYPIIVEGRYDKIKLSSLISGTIITTEGFGVFKNSEKLALIRKLSEKSQIILLTDSDGGGKIIRSHISTAIPKDKLIQLYIPQIKGREKRKTQDSAAGYLGVEGIDVEILYELLRPFSNIDGEISRAEITKTDFFLDGLSGRQNSSDKRDALAKRLGLPSGMTANALLEAVRILCAYDEYKETISAL